MPDAAVTRPLDVAMTAEGFNPLLHLSTAFGLPGVLWSAIYPQVQQLAKRWPRIWRLLTIGVAIHLFYQYTWDRLLNTLKYIVSFCGSSIKIYENDELHSCFTRWVDKEEPGLTQDSSMTGQSRQYRNINRQFEEHESSFHTTSTGIKPLNFVLERSYDVRLFRHKSRIFWITHGLEASTGYHSDKDIKKCLTIWTLGRSVKPIADILDAAVEHHANDGEKQATTLYIPSGTQAGEWFDSRRGGGMWITRTVKPCRPITTVYLAGDQRQMITQDVERFLHPETAQRYRLKGIPHRRGYLFHGPPGNGKSSLAMALAGHFGLNVYSLSLRDPNMNDAYLASLFNVLPPNKVLVLLEDIDSAGLKREEEFEDISDLDDWNYQPRRPRAVHRPVNITLSGVLNAIDGIAAPEGHILVMTTNAPEKLDKALIRPGRIDVKIKFQNASQNQLHDMFERMYRDEGVYSQPELSVLTTSGSEKSTVKFPTEKTPIASPKGPTAYTTASVLTTQPPRLAPSELGILASQFSTAIPSHSSSLAEVQNFLLGHVDDPQRAISEAPVWVEDMLQEKRAAEERKKEKSLETALEQDKIRQRVKEARLNGGLERRDSRGRSEDDFSAGVALILGDHKAKMKEDNDIHETEVNGESTAGPVEGSGPLVGDIPAADDPKKAEQAVPAEKAVPIPNRVKKAEKAADDAVA